LTTIEKVQQKDFSSLIELIKELLIELGDEASEIEKIDDKRIIDDLINNPDRHFSYFAYNDNEIVGMITIAKIYAVYAGGDIGVINEMYVTPDFRSKGVGKMLVDKAKQLAEKNNWKRLDVTAPTEQKWIRTVRFYEKQGFVFTGPKLKFNLDSFES
jgi:GNAT superfamily N-acetyltransferase